MTHTPDRILTLPSGAVWASEHHAHPSGHTIRCWHHMGGPLDYAGLRSHVGGEPAVAPGRPNPIGVAIVLAVAWALIAWGLILAFGDGRGWWAAASIASGLLLAWRVLDVREARR